MVTAWKRAVVAGGVLTVATAVSAAPQLAEGSGASTGSSAAEGDAASSVLCALSGAGSTLVRDTIYLDGGFPIWRTTVNGAVDLVSIPRPGIFSVNLTQPFTLKDFNVSTVVKKGGKPTETFAPPLEDGHVLSNDHQLILYGGTMEDTDSQELPAKNWAISKDLYQKDPVPLQNPGEWRPITMDKVHRGIVGGAYVSAPSENLGFVFGGSMSPGGEDVRNGSPLPENTASILNENLIVADLSTMKGEKWSNLTLPKEVRRRAEAEMVWIPAGEKGTLVVLGGTAMTWNETTTNSVYSSSTVDNWKRYGRSLMETVELYDVKNDEWYLQETSGEIPPPTAYFCAVAATSQDGTVHNIYAYGGTTGLNILSTVSPKSAVESIMPVEYYDHVYVLSLPSFVWKKVYAGESAKSRRGHRCHRISDDKMMIVGGIANSGGSAGLGCVQDFVRIFDMNNAKMLDHYTPLEAGKYIIPAAVQSAIKGKDTGDAGVIPSKWGDEQIPKLLSTSSKSVKNYWPFPAVNDTSTTAPGGPGGGETIIKETSSGLPSYMAPLLGTVLGLLALVTALCIILFYLKKKKQNQKRLMSDSAATEAVNRRRTWSWLIGTHDEKGAGHMHDEFGEPVHGMEGTDTYDGSTVTGGPLSPVDERLNPLHHGQYRLVNEAAQGEIYEMPDSGQAMELPTPEHEHPPKKNVTIETTIADATNEPHATRDGSDQISPLPTRPT